MESRSGLIVQGDLTRANGYAERKAALEMIHRHSPPIDAAASTGRRQGV